MVTQETDLARRNLQVKIHSTFFLNWPSFIFSLCFYILASLHKLLLKIRLSNESPSGTILYIQPNEKQLFPFLTFSSWRWINKIINLTTETTGKSMPALIIPVCSILLQRMNSDPTEVPPAHGDEVSTEVPDAQQGEPPAPRGVHGMPGARQPLQLPRHRHKGLLQQAAGYALPCEAGCWCGAAAAAPLLSLLSHDPASVTSPH